MGSRDIDWFDSILLLTLQYSQGCGGNGGGSGGGGDDGVDKAGKITSKVMAGVNNEISGRQEWRRGTLLTLHYQRTQNDLWVCMTRNNDTVGTEQPR